MAKIFTLAVGLALAFAVVACEGEDGTPRPETATPVPSATPTPGASPERIDGVEVVPLATGDEVGLPRSVELVLEIGCIECHCPCVEGLVLVYRDPLGEVQSEPLLIPEEELPPRLVASDKADDGFEELEPYINGGFAVSDDGSQMYVAVCTRGQCGPFTDAFSEDAQTTVLRSTDGGEAWEELAVLDGAYYINADAITSEGVIASTDWDQKERRYVLLAGGEGLEPPEGAGPGFDPFVIGGEVVWRAKDNRALLRSDGSQYFALTGDPALQINDIVPEPEGDRYATVSWVPEAGGFRFGLVGQDGGILQSFATQYCCVNIGGWLEPGRALGNAYFIPEGTEFSPGLWRPALIDLEAGVAHPLRVPNTFNDYTSPSIARSVMAIVRSP